MPQHKHVILHNVSVAGLDENDNPILMHEEAVMDVPVDQLDAFLADATAKWQSVKTHDECPEHCTAQLTEPDEKKRAKKLEVAHKMRRDEHDRLLAEAQERHAEQLQVAKETHDTAVKELAAARKAGI